MISTNFIDEINIMRVPEAAVLQSDGGEAHLLHGCELRLSGVQGLGEEQVAFLLNHLPSSWTGPWVSAHHRGEVSMSFLPLILNDLHGEEFPDLVVVLRLQNHLVGLTTF